MGGHPARWQWPTLKHVQVVHVHITMQRSPGAGLLPTLKE